MSDPFRTLFVRPTRFHAIHLTSYVGDLSVWLTRYYRRREFDADHAVGSGVIFRRFDNDTPVHPIAQRGHDPWIFEIHAAIVLAGMMMLMRWLRAVAVTSRSETGGNLVGGQKRSHFKMRGQVHRT
jgi:hypothetical protein